MTAPTTNPPPADAAKGRAGDDLTGRDRMMWNVLTSWGGHMVFVVAGFIMPRMIDRHIGQAELGIWDFSWSLVSYFGLAGLGVGSSVNRYVAKLRAAGDRDGLNEAVSSVVCVQAVIATTISVLVVMAVWFLPRFFREHTGVELSEARWVVGLLGGSLAVQQAFDSYRGTMTGCHRWDLHNAINSASYGITVVAMIVLLLLGFDLRALAAAYLAVAAGTEVVRVLTVRRLCPELDVHPRKATWRQAKEMLAFGVKSIVIGLPALLVMQGVSLMIARHLGPAMLAVFSRPLGLIRNAMTFVNKYALILTPTAGSLQGSGRDDEIGELLLRTTRYSVALTLPIILVLTILGNSILAIWMGPRYEAGRILAILGAGCFLPLTTLAAMTILAGLNAHGRIGSVTLVVSVVGMGVGAVAMGFAGVSLAGAALLMSAILTVNAGIILWFASRRLQVPMRRIFRRSFLGPLGAGVPHAAALLAVNYAWGGRPLVALGAGCIASIVILVPIYWMFFLPDEMRNGIRRLSPFNAVAKAMGLG